MPYISLKRTLASHHLWLAEPFSRGQAWIDILFQTNFKPSHMYVRGIRLEIARGQLVWSQDAMATRWKWGRKKVSAFLSELELDKRITRKRDDRIDVITICNYSQYQTLSPDSGTTDDTTNGTTNDPHLKKGNKRKKETPIVPFLRFDESWEIYPTARVGNRDKAFAAYKKAVARGNSEEKILTAVRSYAVSTEARDFPKGFAAWLNDDRFNRDYSQRSIAHDKTSNYQEQALALARKYQSSPESEF